ncbi:MAG: glycosyl transferase family 1, partial [Bacteroidales bacterium]
MEGKSDRHIVIFRFSALGDVAIAAPLVKAYAIANPTVKFTMVSRPMLEPLFKGVDNLLFYPAQLNGEHKGVKGLIKLWRELSSQKVTHVADLHSVLRTYILRVLF